MSFSYRILKNYVTVVRNASISAAALQLHVSQPALTQSIQHLERLVGTTLLDRGPRGVTLTEAGKDLFQVAEQLIEQMDRALDDLKGYAQLRRGSVSIAALPSMASSFLPNLLRLFLRKNPGIHVNIHDALLDHVLDRVSRGLCDMGIIVSTIEDPAFDSEVIGEDKFSVICPVNHALSRRKRVSWREIASYPFIGLSRQSNTRRVVDKSFAVAGEFVSPEYEVQNVSAAARMVEAELGLTVVPELSAHLLGTAKVKWIDLVDPVVRLNLCMIKLAGRSLSPAAQAFWQHVRDHQSGLSISRYTRGGVTLTGGR